MKRWLFCSPYPSCFSFIQTPFLKDLSAEALRDQLIPLTQTAFIILLFCHSKTSTTKAHLGRDFHIFECAFPSKHGLPTPELSLLLPLAALGAYFRVSVPFSVAASPPDFPLQSFWCHLCPLSFGEVGVYNMLL